jgi:Phosphoserine phosphatase RsbU, N-terminal domain
VTRLEHQRTSPGVAVDISSLRRLEDLRRDYRVALLRYLPRGDERASTVGYEIGRVAMTAGVGLLDLVLIHQDLVGEVLEDSRPEDRLEVARTAGEFLLEVLSTFDMAHRGLRDP